jgi:hypothetical protein
MGVVVLLVDICSVDNNGEDKWSIEVEIILFLVVSPSMKNIVLV